MIGGTKQFVLIALTAFCLAGVSCLAPQALEKIDKEGKFAGHACSIAITGGLKEPQPLLIHPGTTRFFNPYDRNGIIYFAENEQVELYCSSAWSFPSGSPNSISVTCNGGLFTYNSIRYPFNEFFCSAYPTHTLKKTARTCFGGAVVVEAGFEVGTRFLPVYEVCFSESREEVHYVKYTLNALSAGYQVGFPRPSFVTGGFFNGKNVDNLYSRATQRQTIAGILGSQELADYYIHPTNDFYMARGHLAAKVDFLFGNQQRATFYFLNTAPQWQRFNAQNWEALEDSSKKFASDRGYDLDVWTGTHGVMGLKDASGTPREIWLYVNGATKQIPVPKIYYRVMVSKSDRRGIVLIGVNNPYVTLDEIKKDYTFCTDVSSQVNYISWQKDDITKGYSYACEVQDFLKSVPHFTVSTSGLLL